MDSQPSISRRHVLQSTAAGTAIGLAGCTNIQDSISTTGDDTDNGDDSHRSGMDPEIDPAEGVVTQVGPSEGEAQQLQQEVLQEAEEEEWSEEETHEELNDRFRERVEDSLDSFEEAMEEHDDITIEGIVPEVGVVLLDGTPEALITALQDEEFASLLPGSQFDDAQQAAEESEDGGEQQPDPSEEPGTEP